MIWIEPLDRMFSRINKSSGVFRQLPSQIVTFVNYSQIKITSITQEIAER